MFEQPGVEYDDLTIAQRAQADVIFLGERMREHTYSVSQYDVVDQWRYYKPSKAAQDMIVKVVTGK